MSIWCAVIHAHIIHAHMHEVEEQADVEVEEQADVEVEEQAGVEGRAETEHRQRRSARLAC